MVDEINVDEEVERISKNFPNVEKEKIRSIYLQILGEYQKKDPIPNYLGILIEKDVKAQLGK